jgi:hypothetical protein
MCNVQDGTSETTGVALTPKKRTSLICDSTSHKVGIVDGVTAGNIGFEEVDTVEIVWLDSRTCSLYFLLIRY